jgi:aspartyl-tRNA synthetase
MLDNVGQDMLLMGWTAVRRDLGALIFIDLRDRTGIMQVVFDAGDMPQADFARAETIRSEYVLAVKGKLVKRAEDTVNPKISTGYIELRVKEFKILSKSETPPIYIEDDMNVAEQLRHKYRYLDLRRPKMQQTLMLRHRITRSVREYLDGKGFVD